MKKSLLALAVLGAFAGAASAQSSVTLYGIVDVGYNSTISNATAQQSQQHRRRASGQPAWLPWFGSDRRGLNAIFRWKRATTWMSGMARPVARAVASLAARRGRLGRRLGYAGRGRIASFSSGTGPFDLFGRIDPFGTGFTGPAVCSRRSRESTSFRMDNTIIISRRRSPASRPVSVIRSSGSEQRRAGLRKQPATATTTARCFRRELRGRSVLRGGDIRPDQVCAHHASPAGAPGRPEDAAGRRHVRPQVHQAACSVREGRGRPTGIAVIQALIPALNGGDADAWMVGLTFPLGAFNCFASYQERDGDSVGRRVLRRGWRGVCDRRQVRDVAADQPVPGLCQHRRATSRSRRGIAATDSVNRQTLMIRVVNHLF